MRLIYRQPCLLLALFLMTACGSEKSISDRLALDLVASYLESNPVYDTGTLAYGNIKLRQKADSLSLAQLQTLEKGGYIRLERVNEKKRFLSKDSTFTIQVQVLDPSIPYVLEKTDKKLSVKAASYSLDESGGVMVEQNGKSRAKVTVTLRRNETDFADFSDKQVDAHTSFIKKTYSLRYIADSGWEVYK